MNPLIRQTLLELSPGGVATLETAMTSDDDLGRVAAFSACHRWCGAGRLPAASCQRLKLVEPDLAWELWSLDTLARAHALDLGMKRDGDYLTKVSRHLDLRESEAVTRSLVLLGTAGTVEFLAREALRSNALSVFQALAVGNPYPARHFEEAIFNQMVVKCLFTNTPVRGIVGLESRLTPGLSRMLRDYRSELEAAHKGVPLDLSGLLAVGAAS